MSSVGVVAFITRGRWIALGDLINNQDNALPIIIARGHSQKLARNKVGELSASQKIEWVLGLLHSVKNKNRIVYSAVSIVAIKKDKVITAGAIPSKHVSMIKSLE